MSEYHSTWRGAHAPTGRSRFGLGLVAVVILVVVVVLVVVQLVRSVPAPALTTRTATVAFPGTATPIPWPSQGQSVLAVQGIGTVGTHTASATASIQHFPIASVTKVMAAMVILKDHPLQVGSTGPGITVTAADVSQYQSDLAQGDSVVPVTAGQVITEYQALEGALIPSADNMIQMLAVWDAGSIPAFVAKMNAQAKTLGMAQTHYADVSGVDPATVSTAPDQLRLSAVAMANPVFAQIVAMPQVTLPGAGVQYNVNADLGTDNIVGIKTGWIPQGGASLAFAATHKVGSRTTMILGVVLGQTGTSPLPTALAAGEQLTSALAKQLTSATVVPAGTTVGSVTAPYSTAVPVVTAAAATLVGWPGAKVHQQVVMTRKLTAPVAKGTVVGHLVVSLGTEHVQVPLVTGAALTGASITWKLTRL